MLLNGWFKDYILSDFLPQSQIDIITNNNVWSKDKLAKKIVDHYFTYEIGFETPELFRIKVKAFMQEIMEEKLPLIYSNSISYDPLINNDLTETLEREVDGTTSTNGESTSEATNNSDGFSMQSDTPQGGLLKQDIIDGKYGTQANSSESNSTINDSTNSSSSGTSNNTENYTKNIKGNSNLSKQKLIAEYRKNVVAIDRDIIESISILFMRLW